MGVGDLNLLKSWNPNLLKNKKKVWKHEQDLLNEDKLFKQKQLEIQKERELKEYNDLLIKNNSKDSTSHSNDNGSKVIKKTGLEWMYGEASVGKQPLNSSNTINNNKNRVTKNVINNKKQKKVMDKNDPMSSFLKNGNSTIKKTNFDREDPMAKFITKK